MLQHLGLIAVLVVVGFGVLVMKRWPMSRNKSFSENIARSRQTVWLFRITMSLVTLLYYAFLAWWLGPDLQVANAYYYLIAIAFMMQLILAWVPASKGLPMRVHSIAAYGVGIVMAAYVFVILLTVELSWFLRALSGLFLAYTVLVYFLVTLVPRSKTYFLYFQLVFFSFFWALILLLTYAR